MPEKRRVVAKLMQSHVCVLADIACEGNALSLADQKERKRLNCSQTGAITCLADVACKGGNALSVADNHHHHQHHHHHHHHQHHHLGQTDAAWPI